ncbi:MAG: hypothetical protein ABII82_14665, partial [Verrucomicrobiota bacterium]
MRRPARFSAPPRRGFALLVTIVLVAFLVLIVVSLAALSRVETSVAANSRQVDQARQNALTALNVAIGQLQKHAGPDQRVTARADLEHGETVPNARWTGAYGRAMAADYAQTPSAIAAALTDTAVVDPATGSSARLLGWLVSGNENDAFDPAAGVAADGRITTDAATLRAGIAFDPATTVTGLTATTTVDTPLTIADSANASRPAALLIGPGTVESAVVSGQAIDYVAAPLVDIDVPADNIPGLTGSTPTTIGRYAWWVGDEGVKARVNLPLVTTDADKPAAFATAARAAVELMDAANPAVPAPALDQPTIGSAYDPASGADRILSLDQFPLIGPATLATTLRRRYHDLTPHSAGVLSDTHAGGLRRDLSALLATGFTPASGDPETDTARLHTLDPMPGLHSEETAGFGVPTWGHLRSYYRDILPVSGELAPRPPVFDQPG